MADSPTIHVRLPQAIFEKICVMQAEEELESQSMVVRKIIRSYFKEKENAVCDICLEAMRKDSEKHTSQGEKT